MPSVRSGDLAFQSGLVGLRTKTMPGEARNLQRVSERETQRESVCVRGREGGRHRESERVRETKRGGRE